MELQTSFGSAHVLNCARDLSPEQRAAAFAARAKDFRYYEIVEESLGRQFEFRYFLLLHQATGESAVQPFFFVNQDLVAGLPRRLRTTVERVRHFWPGFLQLRIMMVGCAAGEGQLDHDAEWLAPALHEAIDVFRPHAKASLILLKDFPAKYRHALGCFARGGYARVPSMPGARLDLDFTSFEQYMGERLGRVFRKNLRRKFKALEGGPEITMDVVRDITPHLDELYPLYLQTYRRSDFKFEELNKDYFRLIGARMPDRTRCFLWRRKGRLIAFSLCLVHEGTIYDLGVGLDYEIALDLHLYFVTWRDVIEWSLRNGITAYHTGPLNYDPKLHLKLSLDPLDLYARHRSPVLNPLFKIALRYLQPARHDPTLRRFPNAHEL